MPKRFRSLIIIPIVLALFGQGCTQKPSAQITNATKPVVLTWWRVFDSGETVQPIVSAYRAMHPNVTIDYKTLRLDEYENKLVNAMAEDRGPDILTLHNTWIPKYQNKLAPIPDTITVPFTHIEGSIKKESVTQLVTNPGLSVKDLKKNFIDTVADDVVLNVPAENPKLPNVDKIFGLPLAADTLVMYYNKDLLNAAGIAQPPVYWTDSTDSFQKMVPKLTKQDAQGNIVQSGAALGTAKNVDRFADILSLLMMQNGTKMKGSDNAAIFNQIPVELSGRPNPPADDALVFYTDFANPAKEVYSWNDKMPSSLTAFASGQTAFFFGYAYNLPTIRAQAPKLNLGIAKVPQISGNPEINYANYWVEGVSKKSANINWAWDFLEFATSAEQATKYLDAAHRPTALRALIGKQTADIDLSVFADQLLTAKSWYHGKNEAAAEQALADMIYAALNGANIRKIINDTANRVNQTIFQ
jgi:multiple sugar transport system substrate-binding protein